MVMKRLAEWWTGILDRHSRYHDSYIDAAIARNRAKPIQGMERPSVPRVYAMGKRRWDETMDAQDRLAGAERVEW